MGVGKTTAMIELLLTIREEHGRAIVYDRMGTLVEKFYNPARGDKIINPFDKRSVAWSPFYEASDIASFSQMAEVLIPSKPDSPDPFWQTAARLVFEFAAKRLLDRGDGNNRSMREVISIISDEELIELVAQTPAAALLSEKSPKTAQGIRANLISELRFFEFLRDDAERFSIRDWVKNDEPGFIYLTGDSEHAAATRNVISACLEIAANALMTCGQSREPKLWFMMDELPTLNKLPFIEKSLAEIRQFGGAFVIGYQVYAQLEQIYGEKGARSISGVLNNRLIFNSPDAMTAKFLSESLGQEDVVDQRQTITMGAHSTRDGAGFNEQRVERAIVTASEIQNLPTLTAFLRFAYDAPAAKVKFNYISMPDRAEAYLPYDGDGFAYGSLEQEAESITAKVEIEDKSTSVVTSISKYDPEQALYLFEEWKSIFYQKTFNFNDVLNNREPVICNKKYLRFDPEKYNFWEDIYADDFYTQKLLWDHLFMSLSKGLDLEKITELRFVNSYTMEEYKPLLKVIPPFPFPRPTDGPEEPVGKTNDASDAQNVGGDVFETSYSSRHTGAFFND